MVFYNLWHKSIHNYSISHINVDVFWGAFLCCGSTELCFNSSPLDKIVAISETAFSNALSSMNSFVFEFEFHWGLSLGVQLTISQH